MGRYFGRQPPYTQEEAEAQAKAALDAAVNKGRPPEEEWKALGSRMGEINRELAARPPVDLPSPPPRPAAPEKGKTRNTGGPRAINEILRPRPAPAPEPAPPPRPKRATAAPAKRASPDPAVRPTAKRAAKANPAAGTPSKRSTGATGKAAPAPAKRPAAKKRPG